MESRSKWLTLPGLLTLTTMAKSKFNVTIIDSYTLETYLWYSNINQTGKSIHNLLTLLNQNNKLKESVVLYYDSACLPLFYNIYIFVSKQLHSFNLKIKTLVDITYSLKHSKSTCHCGMLICVIVHRPCGQLSLYLKYNIFITRRLECFKNWTHLHFYFIY